MRKEVKFGMRDLFQGGLILVVTGVALTFGTDINASVRDDIGDDVCSARTDNFTGYNTTGHTCVNQSVVDNVTFPGVREIHPGAAEFNVSENSIEGVVNLTSKFPQIGLVLAAIVIIGLLVGLMVFR